ncbi:MAG: PTS fructose transporter subunit IIA [Bdellovibrio sp.]|nr:PTS fructose transporter subunit IIA [Methylotenera sp.]
MIGILIIAHGGLGESLIHCVSHVLGKQPPQLAHFAVGTNDDPSDLYPQAQQMVSVLNTGSGVLILSDMYGASPCNLVAKLLSPGQIEGVAGVNLPMLVRVLNYRDKPIKTCLEKAISGGRDGVVHFTKTSCEHNK